MSKRFGLTLFGLLASITLLVLKFISGTEFVTLFMGILGLYMANRAVTSMATKNE